MKFKQYDVVRLIAFNVQQAALSDDSNLRRPAVGDVATIIELYSSPLGYELECSDADGITQWLFAFRPEDVVLELHR
jgi:hypothetical protein